MYDDAKGQPVHHQMAGPEAQVEVPPTTPMPIAIIGMSCRFPGDADSPEKFWELCANGRSAWSEIPENRFNKESFYHPVSEKSTTVSIVVLCCRHCC